MAIRTSTSARRRLAGESGSQLVEFAMILPILLMIIAAIVDFGVMFRTNAVVTNAAREGARLAAIPGNDQNNYETVRARVAAAAQRNYFRSSDARRLLTCRVSGSSRSRTAYWPSAPRSMAAMWRVATSALR